MFYDKVATVADTKTHDKFDKIEQNIEHKMESKEKDISKAQSSYFEKNSRC
jgi:hypothetical protein